MPRLKDVRITDTMVKAAIMYEDGDNAAEIAAKPIVSGGVNVAYPLAQGAYYDNLNKRFKK